VRKIDDAAAGRDAAAGIRASIRPLTRPRDMAACQKRELPAGEPLRARLDIMLGDVDHLGDVYAAHAGVAVSLNSRSRI